jgi:hypothetical protein
MAVREREEHDVVAGEDSGVGVLQHTVGERQQARMMLSMHAVANPSQLSVSMN